MRKREDDHLQSRWPEAEFSEAEAKRIEERLQDCQASYCQMLCSEDLRRRPATLRLRTPFLGEERPIAHGR